MNHSATAAVLIGIFLFTFCVTPVLAATVSCPSGCSCLLPAEAKKLGYSGYCNGQQAVCGYDAQKNAKYCYEKPVTTTKTTVTTTPTTAPVPGSCPAGCICCTPEDGKLKGLSPCGGVQTLCGYSQTQQPMYCHALPATTATTKPAVTTTVTTTPAPQCPSGCYCLLPDEAKAKGLTYCNGQMIICDKGPSGVVKYCFAGTAVTTATTTVTPAAGSCPAGCSCLLPDEAKAKGLAYCNGIEKVCAVPSVDPVTGAATSASNKYCYGTPETGCPAGCSCLAPDKADAAGLERCSGSTDACATDPLGRPMYCYVLDRVTMVSPVSTATPATAATPAAGAAAPLPVNLPVTTTVAKAPAQQPDMFMSIGTFFATIFGGTSKGPGGFAVIACPFGLTACDGRCVDLRTDTENCGDCRVTCPGQLPLCCDGTCSSMISAENCGTCGNACPAGQPCSMVDGWAVCSVAGCADTFLSTDCGTGVCIDPDWNSEHCGSCGHACPDHYDCQDGVCTPCPPGTDRCGTGDLASGGECTSLDTHSNCGGCGIVCGPGLICEGGACVPCPAGTSWCGGDNCIDLMSSYYSCGSCGTWCNQTVPNVESCCGGRCINLKTSETDCGTCGHACGEGQGCVAGTCLLMPTVGSVEILCRLGQTACDHTCVSLGSDESNCGACGHACSSGEVCIERECLPAGGEDGCALGQVRCSGRCVYPETDRANCGRCGHECPPYFTCRESTCTPFFSGDDTVCDEPGLDYCSGDCADLRTDERHCGRCGNSCPGGTCLDGVCYYLNSDAANCGSVGHRCGSGEICCYGTCRALDTGDPEWCACSAAPCRASDGLGCCNGYCWDIANDIMNCGSCGHECGDGDRCCGGRCVDIWWDEDNCGRCGHDCPWGKECQNGHCCLWGTTWGCD